MRMAWNTSFFSFVRKYYNAFMQKMYRLRKVYLQIKMKVYSYHIRIIQEYIREG